MVRGARKRLVGPLDKRIKTRRCLPCVRAHLKCEGGIPCKRCLVTDSLCSTTSSGTSSVTLAHVIVSDLNHFQKPTNHSYLPPRTTGIAFDPQSYHLQHFFSLVLPCFTGYGSSEHVDVGSLLKDSSAVRDSALALSALFALNRDRHSCLHTSTATPFQYYRSAVSAVRAELKSPEILKSTSSLWATFFLSLFEVSYDSSGAGFVAHFLNGTCRLLQHRGASRHCAEAGKRFLLFVRPFEICRSLIFTQDTFLAQQDWQEAAAGLLGGQATTEETHPLEVLYNLMIRCSTLAVRSRPLVELNRGIDPSYLSTQLQQVAREGWSLRTELYFWNTTAFERSVQTQYEFQSNNEQDHSMELALIYYHAISIYLSGIFDYHSVIYRSFDLSIPILLSSDVDQHVNSLLGRVKVALCHTHLSGLLFLFPLRVAGARAFTQAHQQKVKDLLKLISAQGIAVSQAFIDDLAWVWEGRRQKHGAASGA